MGAMGRCLRFSLLVAIGATTLASLVACGSSEERASSSTPEPTTPATASPQPSPAGDDLAGVPSGSVVFLTAGGYSYNLYVVDADGGEPKQLLDSAESDRPGAFSPDGKLIAYTSFLRDDGKPEGVYVMSPDRSNPQPVTGDGMNDWFISWSSQGRILYGEGVMGPADYWTIKPDGSERAGISQMNTCSEPVDWSPDGESLVLCQCTATPEGKLPCTLSIIDQQGNSIGTLPEDEGTVFHSPRWSPGGSQILFIRQTPSGEPSTLVVIDADGSNVRSLYQAPADAPWVDARWSPDSSRIAVMTPSQIAVVSPVDGSSHAVASGKNINYFAWSPDSDRIAYVSESDGCKLYVVGSEGGEPKVVADPVANTDVAWSPDGKQVLFASNRARQDGVWWASPDGSTRGRLEALSEEFVPPVEPTVEGVVGGCTRGSQDVSCLSPDGSSEAVIYPNAKVLTIRDVASGATRGIDIDAASPWYVPPVWSIDGTKIALYAGGDGKRALYVVDIATEEVTLVAVDAGSIGLDPSIAWSPDGSYVYFTKGMICGEGCAPGFLYRVHPDGTVEERVVDMRIGLIYGFKP
jgi:Tol biopolymer transport system component